MNVEALPTLRRKVTELLELRHNLGDRSHSAVESQQIQQGRKQFFKPIAAGFGLAFFIMFAVGVGSYHSITRLVETFNQPAPTQNALGGIEKLFSQVNDAQTGQQEFLAASQVIRTDKGKNLLDETRVIIHKLENELKQRADVASSSVRAYVFAFSNGIFLNFFVLVGVYYLIHREMQRQRMEEALRESEARFKAFMDNSPTVAFMKDEEGRYVYLNKPFERRFNINLADCLGKTDFDLWPDAIAKQLRENDTHVLTVEKTVEMLESVPTPDGCLHHWLVFKFLCQDISGRRLVGGVAVDITSRKQAESELRRVHDELELRTAALEQEITERKRAEKQIKLSLQEKEVLLKEIHHRVKNNLQVVESLLRLQSKYTKNEHAVRMFRESQNRIKSMALIHEKLYQSIDLAKINFVDYIQSLVASLFRSYSINSTAINPTIDVADIFFSIDTAIPCGLIINELVANSLKYAFPESKQGQIHICLRSKDENKFILIVSDNGVGFPKDLDFRDTKSLGLQLVTSLTEQLGAIIELHSHSGTEFRLTFTDVKSEAKK